MQLLEDLLPADEMGVLLLTWGFQRMELQRDATVVKSKEFVDALVDWEIHPPLQVFSPSVVV